MEQREWTALVPHVARAAAAKRIWLDCSRRLAAGAGSGAADQRLRSELLTLARGAPQDVAADLALAVCVLHDLVAQGWLLRVVRARVEIASPQIAEASANAQKAIIRSAHLVERDAQLCQPPTRRFIQDMERRRQHKGEWRSIFSLLRDGRELEERLRTAGQLLAASERAAALRNCIDPYLQPVRSGARCAFTGLRLSDIWRYFRHTWNTVYQSTPGRNIWFLVRDRAAANHPVIGIGSFGSAIVQLAPRDEWIGWAPDKFIERLQEAPTLAHAKWVHQSLRDLIRAVYVADFRKSRLLRHDAISSPSERTIGSLRQFAKRQRKAHRLYPDRQAHKSTAAAAKWRTEARTPLFRAKRAEHLADLLEARLALKQAGFARPTEQGLRGALDAAVGRKAIRRVLRYVKASRVGVNMMDITVCGAIAPYNHILGGKLVGLLLASPGAATAYVKRYRQAESVIASSIAGRPIRRRPSLVLLGTTSLYGVASSQYNRLQIPADALGGAPGAVFGYMPLGRTVGYGSFHFSQDTMALIEIVLARHQGGRAVNSIFGEGVNPKLRKLRAALDTLGLESDLLLQHKNPRLIYGVPLATNFREVLLGLTSQARPVVPSAANGAALIAEYWRTRWLSRRIQNQDVLTAVRSHTLAYPIRHGGRVPLPAIPEPAGAVEPETGPSSPRAHSNGNGAPLVDRGEAGDARATTTASEFGHLAPLLASFASAENGVG
jgi:hypothetical protein